MRKKSQSRQRKHRVRCSMQVLELTKAGSSMRFDVYAENEKMGRVVIGQGSFTWYGGKRKVGWTLTWSDFAKMMNERCYSE